MPNVKISELTAASSVEDDDLFETSEAQGGGAFSSKKVTAAQFKTYAAVGTGTITSIVASTGLTGGTITASGTIAADVATDTNIRAGTASKLIAAAEIYSAAAPVALTDGATIAPDLNAGRVFSVTLAGNRTLTNPTNQVAGQGGMIIVSQDATGSRTLSYGTAYDFSGGAPTLTTAASGKDVISYYVQSSGVILCTISKAFA